MMVRAVDYGNAHRSAGERLRREQAAKTAPQDNYVLFHLNNPSRKRAP